MFYERLLSRFYIFFALSLLCDAPHAVTSRVDIFRSRSAREREKSLTKVCASARTDFSALRLIKR